MNEIHPAVTGVIMFLLALLLFTFECRRPLRRRTRTRVRRILVNIVLIVLTFVAGYPTVQIGSLAVIERSSNAGFGFLYLFPLPGWGRFLLGFLLIDLTFYYWHRANHAVPLLWRFHNVHHMDPDMDVTTAYRFHFVEVLYSALFRVLQVGVLGISLLTYEIYELTFHCVTAFHHSNLRIPIRIERWINRILVTPRMHGIHHSMVRNEANSNYSVVFRWWDWLHRTIRLGVPQGKIRIGVAGYEQPRDNRVWNLIAAPFRRQRDYWRFADGTAPHREGIPAEKTPEVLAE